MSNRTKIVLAVLFVAAFFLPDLAFAANAGGGGMPYDNGMNKLGQSIQGPVAYLICLVAVVCGVGAYLMAGQLEGLMQTLMRCIIGVCIITAVGAFITAVGGTSGAIV